MGESTLRLMVVHWHPGVLMGLAGCLSREPDMELVGSASSCEQALDMADEAHPDLVLIGYSTPSMGGIEATRRLIEAHPDTRVVLVGVMDGPERRAGALASGAMGYVLLDWVEIPSAVRRLVWG